jgi:hypothetical protein
MYFLRKTLTILGYQKQTHSNIKPGRDPHIFNVEPKPQDNFDYYAYHDEI